VVIPRASWWHGRSGKVKLGCLFQIVLIAGLAYYGSDWGKAYYKYWSVKEAMRSQAIQATGIDDATIHRRILVKIEALGLPAEAKSNIRINRQNRPREIVISTSYVVFLRIPFRGPLERTLNPKARYAL
jgi:hypothetical protein